MVHLATRTSGRSPQSPHKTESATVVLGCELISRQPNAAMNAPTNVRYRVESRCGAVAVGRTYLLPPLSSGGALLVRHDSVSTSLSLIHISEPTRLGMISYA